MVLVLWTCGTPGVTRVKEECSPPTTTFCSQNVRKLEIQVCVLLLSVDAVSPCIICLMKSYEVPPLTGFF